jgi:hypothetical protein
VSHYTGLPVLTLEQARAEDLPPAEHFADHTVFQTEPWLRVVNAIQPVRPVFARVMDGGTPVGRYTGLVLRRAGVPVLASPFPGWNTYHMGFNLEDGVPRAAAVRALQQFAFRELGCMHLEVMDRGIDTDTAREIGWAWTEFHGFVIDLRRSEDELLAGMTSDCRRCLRKAAREGVALEAVADPAGFVDEHYAQLEDVFAKQGLVPKFPKSRVAAVVRELGGTESLLLVRARDPLGRSIATAIFVASGDTSYFWSGASWRWGQSRRPNEAVQWFAMQHWRARGVDLFDMGGPADYKRRYGGTPYVTPWLRRSRYAGLEQLRNVARTAIKRRHRLRRSSLRD